MTYENKGATFLSLTVPQIAGLIMSVIVIAGVLVPICESVGGQAEENEGILCMKIGAGYTATATASETEQYALIGDTVAIVPDGDNLHAYGIGINEVAESFAISYDGTVLTIGSVSVSCAWAFVPSDTGDFRYGDGGKAGSIDDVYGAGIYEGIFYSIHGEDDAKAGAVA